MIRQQIRTALYYEHGATKVEIAQVTGTTFPTVSKAIEEMKEEGEVLLSGLGESNGGRRPQLYMLNPEHKFGLTVYLEKDYSIYTLLNYSGEVILRERLPGVLQDGPAALDRQITVFLETYPLIGALTFGVPASVNNGQVAYIPDYDKFAGFDFKAAYQDKYALYVQIENDMNATVLGYYDKLDLQKELSLVYLYFGVNGPGAGIIANGRLVRGKTSFSGEVSFLPLYDNQTFYDVMKELAEGPLSPQRHAKLIDAMSRLIAVFTATLNPDMFVFCSINMTEADLCDVREQCGQYIPLDHIPALVIGNWEEDYIHGLQQLTIKNMLGTGEG
jgi:hypothetical protein